MTPFARLAHPLYQFVALRGGQRLAGVEVGELEQRPAWVLVQGPVGLVFRQRMAGSVR